jgi:TM2 domain-containing membrane protein YozV
MHCPACGKDIADDAVVCVGCGRAVVPFVVSHYGNGDRVLSPEAEDFASKKIPAAICGIFLGAFGVHKFVLGQTKPALIMLLVTFCSCFIAYPVMHTIGLIEGIIYLTKTDAEFYRTYAVENKEWF